MRKTLLSLLLVAFIILGTHGAFIEVPNDGIPLVLVGGTGGVALEYHADLSDRMFIRPGLSLGSEGVEPAGSLGYRFKGSPFDTRLGVFNGKPYIAVGIGL